MRHGQRKFDAWKFNIESRIFVVDVFIIRPLSERDKTPTKFRAVNKELELAIEDVNIDELRKRARSHCETAGKTTWSRWIYYTVEHRPRENERGNFSTSLSVSWRIVERCEIGTKTERYRDVEGGQKFGRITTGTPDTGYAADYRGRTREDEFSGLVEFDPKVSDGLDTISLAIAGVYSRLRDVLIPGTKTNPAKFLAGNGIPALIGSSKR